MTDKITNKITKIVLTGGPCAGKTTAMARIIEHFSGLGFQVFAIPEVPTMFSSAGINYLTQNKALFFEAEKSTSCATAARWTSAPMSRPRFGRH